MKLCIFRGKIAFWAMSSAMMLMVISFGIAGVVQSYLERALGMGNMATRACMRFWMQVTFVLGLIFFAGVLLLVTDLLSPRLAERST